ncbi:hypothetical protein IB237_23490 [Agrobacterium sp. AGB01]|uniref:hypothetical protein n=1 Tax=Agrobacterium sp. AGB01 TaxID=2769302 RepID=UPI001780A008|nr:hypothetical protein [Agrobacterium sp. AGB01]MBD9390169.1 hypothetical protein [Agrobacterium sp. AGB01]
MDIEHIKQAIAAVAPGSWSIYCEETPDKAAAKDELAFQVDRTEPFVGKIHHIAADGRCVATTGCGPNSKAHAIYLHAVNPEAITELVEKFETLQEENAELIIGIRRLSEDEELLTETSDGDMISVVKLAARLAEAEEVARSYEAEANQLREVSKANRERANTVETELEKLCRWLPISEADTSVDRVHDYADLPSPITNSEEYWVRDDDGRIYQATWVGSGKRAYWWDLEGESPVNPIEFMPHPLARFTTKITGGDHAE